jgi:hydroxypyruvate reductase
VAQATKARVLSLILSDVVGNPLEAIASGPTAPDPTTKEDALAVLEKFFPVLEPSNRRLPRRNDSEIPASILQSLISSAETPKSDNPLFSRVQNVIVGDNALAVRATLKQAQREGFQVESLGNGWQGEAREVGVALARKLRVANKSVPRSFCLIAGGETTVTLRDSSSLVRPFLLRGQRDYVAHLSTSSHSAKDAQLRSGQGSGGRNQELALAAVPELAGLEAAMLISLATDGKDGPTDAAGAVVTNETLRRAERLGLDVAGYLSRHDAYPFFERLGDLIKTGPTGTNVNDLVFLLAVE